MSGTILSLEHVWKQYRLSRLGARSIREELVRGFGRLSSGGRSIGRRDHDEFFALRDVSCVVEAGETVGFIGPNGSGKSTLLKLLAHITYPTRGRVRVHGSVASLIEVGAGFHPELTGRENIYLYGSIMGMSRSEVRAKFESIVAFSELEVFLDTPVKRYSSGMYVRLGFAVAAHVDPRILLVDEVLAVGDAAFKNRCLQRIESLRRGGTTIVFVSHDMPAVERLCSRVFLLRDGAICAEGGPSAVIGDYYQQVVFPRTVQHATSQGEPTDGMSMDSAVADVCLMNRDGLTTNELSTGETLRVRVGYRTVDPVQDLELQLHFYAADGQLQCCLSTGSCEALQLSSGVGEVEVTWEELGLMPGLYRIDAALARRGAIDTYHVRSRAALLKVVPGRSTRGIFHAPQRWRLLSPAPAWIQPRTEQVGGS